MPRRELALISVLAVGLGGLAHATPTAKIAVTPKTASTNNPTGLIDYRNQESTLKGNIELLGTVRRQEEIKVDKDGTTYAPEASLNSRFRVNFDYRHNFRKYVWVDAQYEHDLYTGVSAGGSESADLLVDANRRGGASELRKALLGVQLGYVGVSGGITTSHWGLGLLANDGKHGWRPNNAYFSDPRSGDRVLRSRLVGTIPPANIALILAYDRVLGDDVLIGDDEANQIIGAVVVNPRKQRTGGIYVARRTQTHGNGGETLVTAIDAYGKWTQEITSGPSKYSLVAEIEAATIIGTTDLGPNPDFESHDVLQFGVLSRVSFGQARWGTVLDVLFASGDQNTDDGEINGFKADRNVDMGQLIFRQALAAISARSPVTASNPELVGEPSADLDRLPTRGAVTNTLSLFPRLWFRCGKDLTVYGGPLFAFSNVPAIDPLNTRTAGGEPRNAYDAKPGSYLGTELNLGMRYRPHWKRTQFLFGIEAAHFTPGEAFVDGANQRPSPITGGRVLVGYTL